MSSLNRDATVRSRRKLHLTLSAALLTLVAPPAVLAAAPSSSAQAHSARIVGTVNDAHNKPIAGALVQLTDAAGKPVATTLTDHVGAFAVEGLAPGHYVAIASRKGQELSRRPVDVAAGETEPVQLIGTAQLSAVTVTARREAARNTLSPTTGSSQYSFNAKAIDQLPQGDNTPLNEVLLQAPGVVNDSGGQLHVRGDHGDLQYRINGVILPEGASGFGQTLDTRFAQKVDLLTGALPAQYGYRTAGVVDITTKDDYNGGVIDLYGGSHDTINPSLELGKTTDRFSAFFSGSYLSSKQGIEAPTDSYEAIHDRTTQGKGFGYLAYKLTPNMKLSGMFGTAVNRFEIPNTPNQPADSTYLAQLGLSGFDSSTLDERQFERTNYGLLALQGVAGHDVGYQLALFDRVSAINYVPDPVGDLVYNGDASTIKRKSSTLGLQGDIKVPLSENHTLRAGLSASTEDDRADNTASVFTTVDPQSDGSCPAGSQASDAGYCVNGGPVTIVDNNPKNGNALLGLYVQDQWDLSDSVTVNYGLRYDKLNAYVSAQQLSPRVGLIWYASDATTVHAGYARYFTPPPNELVANSSLALFANTTNAPEVTTNSPVKPERDHYFDAGLTHQFTPHFNMGLDAYYKYARDLIDEGQFGSALIYTPFNYTQGHIYGLEITSAYHAGPLSAYLNLAHTIAQATGVASGQFNFSQDDLNYIAQHYIYLDHDQHYTASGGVSYLWRGTTYGVAATYGDGLRNDGDGNVPNGGKEPVNMQVDLSVSRPVYLGSFGEVDLRGVVLNVLDRKNQIHDGSGVGVGAAQYGPRVGFYFGIAKPFGKI